MKNKCVKKVLLKRDITAKQSASDLELTPVRFHRIIGGFECPKELVEKIARYLGLKNKQVNKNYKENCVKTNNNKALSQKNS